MPKLDFDFRDEDGYPTEELLEYIKSYSYTDGWKPLMDLVYAEWSYDFPYRAITVEEDHFVYELSTGGWSGNESLVDALKENHMFWIINWYSSRRGGHYVFKIRKGT